MSGISETELTLVRNPNYNAATDSKAARENMPDRFEFVVNTNVDDIYNKIASGDYEDAYASPTAKVIREYSTNASKRKLLKINSADQINYITMNLTQPPFDDVARAPGDELGHGPRRPAQAWGGPVAGQVAEPHPARRDAQRRAEELPAVQDAGRPRERREGEGRDGASRSTPTQGRRLLRARSARTSS